MGRATAFMRAGLRITRKAVLLVHVPIDQLHLMIC
jgi:hypothetical protein